MKQVKGMPLVYNDRIDPEKGIEVSSQEDYLIEEETNSEKSRQLHEVLKSLSKRQRECLMLKFEHNLSYVEIAEILEITVESARTMVYRSLKELRKCFTGMGKSVQLFLLMLTFPYH